MHGYWLTRAYLALLRLFPAAYRKEYGEELAYAIYASVDEARAKGGRALAELAWRELRDLPGALLAAHLAALDGFAIYPNHARPSWFFYPAWVVLSAVSLPIAVAITFVIIALVIRLVGDTIVVQGQTHITEDYLAMWILFPLIGLVTGCLQFLVIRRYVARPGWWVPATTLGWVLSFYVLRLMYTGSHSAAIPGVVMATAALGATVAFPQWWVLRRRVRKAGWWLIAGAVAWGLAGLVTGPSISAPLDVVAVALIPALATAIALWLLLVRLLRDQVLALDV